MSDLTNKNTDSTEHEYITLSGKAVSWDKEKLIKTVEDSIKDIGLVPRWLAVPVDSCVDLNLEDYDLESLDEVLGKEYLIAGGFLTKLFYNKDWESDVDIWLNSREFFKGAKTDKKYRTTRKKMEDAAIMDGLEIDLVYNNFKSFSDVITNFDLSCCQIGYERKTDKVLVTPLFMYTYYTGKIIVMPRNVMINYTGTIPMHKGRTERNIKKTMKELFFKKRITDWETRGTKKYDENLKYQEKRVDKYTKRGIGKSSVVVFLD